MLSINYIPVIVWMLLFRMGMLSLLVMLPVTVFCITLDYIFVEGGSQVRFWCMNLLGSTVAGIGLSTYLYLRYVNADRINIVYSLISLVFFIGLLVIGSFIAARMNEKKMRRNRRRNKIYGNGLRGAAPALGEETDRYDSGKPLRRMREAEEDEEEYEDPDEEDAEDEEEVSGDRADEDKDPKFRVIVKKGERKGLLRSEGEETEQ